MVEQAGFSEQRFSAPDGLVLSARIYGTEASGHLPVVCLPGLTRNARDFHDLALYLSTHPARPRKVVVFDYRGRGRSDYDPDWRNYSVPVETRDVISGLVATRIERAVFVGTSRGGLIIHALAGARPAAIAAAVLNDIGPVLEGAGLAQIRATLERSPRPSDFAQATELLKAAHGPAFTALSDEDWKRWTHAIYREAKGRPVADYDPALLKTLKGIDLNRPLPNLWPQFHGLRKIPVLVIRGENSKLLASETVAAMARVHKGLESLTVEGQGHAPLIETGSLPAQIAAFAVKADARH